MKKQTFSTNDIAIAAILTTIKGIELKTLSFEIYEGKMSTHYQVEYPEILQSTIDLMLRQYENKSLIIDQELFGSKLKVIRAYELRKVNALRRMNFKNILG